MSASPASTPAFPGPVPSPGAAGRDHPAGPPWSADAVALGAALVALGLALLGPRLLPDTDPLGVDPHSLRLGAVSIALLVATGAVRSRRPALAVQLAVAAVVLPFVLWQSTPWLVDRLAPSTPGHEGALTAWLHDYRSELLVTYGLYALASLAVAVAAARLAGATWWRWLRLGGGRAALVATVATVAGMCLVFLAIPATSVGRVALPLATLSHELPYLGPAYCLQAAAQELAFRGALLRTLERGAPFWAANVGQSLLFGLAHIAVQYEGPADTLIPITVGLGLAFGWVTWRTGSIWPAVVAHAVLEIGQAYGVLGGLYGY